MVFPSAVGGGYTYCTYLGLVYGSERIPSAAASSKVQLVLESVDSPLLLLWDSHLKINCNAFKLMQ